MLPFDLKHSAIILNRAHSRQVLAKMFQNPSTLICFLCLYLVSHNLTGCSPSGSQPPSYSSSSHTPELDFYPTKYHDQIPPPPHPRPRDLTGSRDLAGSRDFKGSRDFNARPSAFSKFTRDGDEPDPVFSPYQQ